MDIVENIIHKGTKYVSGSKGDIPEDALFLSASQVGAEPLQIYLRIMYGSQDKEEITDATLGTILHHGMEKIVNEQAEALHEESGVEIDTEVPMHIQLPNRWYVTGTADLIVKNGNSLEIHDYKFTKYYALKKFEEEKISWHPGMAPHQYTLQLNTLRYLAEKMELADGEVSMHIDYFIRDANKLKGEPVHRMVEPPRLDGIEEILTEKTDLIQSYIVNAEVPPVCSDLWPRKLNGKFIPDMRCQFYCDMKSHCPYYKSKGQHGFDKALNLAVHW